MKLLLTSAGLCNQSIVNTLLALTGKPFTELNLAFIPTAANVEPGNKDWLINDFCNCQKLGFSSIDIVDISALPQEIWLPRLEMADVILVGGGNVSHLMHWVERSGLGKLLPALLATRVYVGISAGSMIMCRSLDLELSERLYSEVPGEYQKDEGLGLFANLIRPHLNSSYFPEVNLPNLERISQEFPNSFYAIDDNTAIKVVDDKIEIISEGMWKKYN